MNDPTHNRQWTSTNWCWLGIVVVLILLCAVCYSACSVQHTLRDPERQLVAPTERMVLT